MVSPNEVSCLFFDYDESLCLQRARLRLDHPTLTSDSRCKHAIRSMSKNLKQPSLSEGFGSIVIIRSIEAANFFVQYCCGTAESWGSKASSCSPSSSSSAAATAASHPEPRFLKFHKFPRTGHLFNFGSATGNDLIMTEAGVDAFVSSSTVRDREGEKVAIILEENVDDAN